jgi:uncharacterized protein (TIGR02118 family)
MTKVSIHYPNKPGSRFDEDYYINVHMPMAISSLGAAIKAVSVEIGVSGALPGQAPPYAALCHFVCDSAEAFYNAFMPHAAALQGDMINYTDIEPIIQISEIRWSPYHCVVRRKPRFRSHFA